MLSKLYRLFAQSSFSLINIKSISHAARPNVETMLRRASPTWRPRQRSVTLKTGVGVRKVLVLGSSFIWISRRGRAGQTSPGDGSVCAHPPGMLRPKRPVRLSQTVDRRKINLTHNFGQRGPPAVYRTGEYTDCQERWCCHWPLLVVLYTPFTYCQRAPRWFLSPGFELNASGSQTIAPASPVDGDLLSLEILSTIPWLSYWAESMRHSQLVG